MRRRRYVALAATASLAGCSFSRESKSGRLDLTVQNERDQPVTARVTVTDDEDTTFERESYRVDAGVSQSVQVTVGETGRHEVTVSGDDWSGALAWNADTCARFDATVRVTPESVEVEGECVQPR